MKRQEVFILLMEAQVKCERCGHDFYTDTAYATCDACQTFFYASQSKTAQPPQRVVRMGTSVLDSSGGWRTR